MRLAVIALLLALAAPGCGGDDDDAAEDDTATATATATVDVAASAAEAQEESRGELDEAMAEYIATELPGLPPYVGECEVTREAICGQFRSIDSRGYEYFVVGDPGAVQSALWVIVEETDDGWAVVGHDLSPGWRRGQSALVAPGACAEVRPEPGSGSPASECLPPLSPVTISAAPQLEEGALFFQIGTDRWTPGRSLCDPASDSACAAAQ